MRRLLIALLTISILALWGTEAAAKKHSVSPFEAPALAASPCGASVRDAIAAAEQDLQEKTTDNQTRALGCIVAALKFLDHDRLDAVRGKEHTRVLSVPKVP